jgi:hypothetical protein
MTIEELKAFIEENQDNQEVQGYVKGFVTPDRVKDYLESEEGKRLLQPKLDQYFTKGLETWKQSSLPKIVEDKIREKFPEETESEKRIRALEEKLEHESKARTRQEVKSKAIKMLSESQYPLDFVDFLDVSDETELTAKFGSLKAIMEKWLTEQIDKKFKDSGRTPRKPEEGKNGKNPWSKEHLNLTEQGRLLREDPELARFYKENARR